MDYVDEAQEALSIQHDREIEEFYVTERERVRSMRLEQLEGHIALNSTDSSEEDSSTSSWCWHLKYEEFIDL